MVKRRNNTDSAEKKRTTKENTRVEAEDLEKRTISTTDPRLSAEKNAETWSRKEDSESGKTKVKKPKTKNPSGPRGSQSEAEVAYYTGYFAGKENRPRENIRKEVEVGASSTITDQVTDESGMVEAEKAKMLTSAVKVAAVQPVVNAMTQVMEQAAHSIIKDKTVCALETINNTVAKLEDKVNLLAAKTNMGLENRPMKGKTLENTMNAIEKKVDLMVTRSTRGRPSTINKAGGAAMRVTRNMSKNQKSDQDEEVVVVHEPVMVDLDSDDLRRYIENKVDSIRGEPEITDVNKDISEYIDRKIEEKLLLIFNDNEKRKRGLDDDQRKMILATLNSKQMVCECCPEGNHRASKATLTWHTATQSWSDGHGKIEPMTSLKAWAQARKMVVKIRNGNDQDHTWYKCVLCDVEDNNLMDIHYGQDQLRDHISRGHKTTIDIYQDICNNNIGWVERRVTRRFQNIIKNVHRPDYDNQLRKIRGGSRMAYRVGYHQEG